MPNFPICCRPRGSAESFRLLLMPMSQWRLEAVLIHALAVVENYNRGILIV